MYLVTEIISRYIYLVGYTVKFTIHSVLALLLRKTNIEITTYYTYTV